MLAQVPHHCGMAILGRQYQGCVLHPLGHSSRLALWQLTQVPYHIHHALLCRFYNYGSLHEPVQVCVRWRCVIEQINRSTDQQQQINRSTGQRHQRVVCCAARPLHTSTAVATQVQGEYIAWLARLAVACMVAQPGYDSREGRLHGWGDRRAVHAVGVVMLWRWSCVAVCMVVIAAARGVWWHRWRRRRCTVDTVPLVAGPERHHHDTAVPPVELPAEPPAGHGAWTDDCNGTVYTAPC